MEKELVPIALMVIFGLGIIGSTIVTIVKTVCANKQQWGKNGNLSVPPLFEKMFEKAASERDEKIRKLEERIVVLEKIVTDSHRSSRLADEIDKLRDEGA
jgi:hypothetical protein